MSDELEPKEEQQQATNTIEALQARLEALEKKYQAPKLDPTEEKIKELTKRIEQLQKKEEVETMEATVDDALSREQEFEKYHQKRETREKNIERLEKETKENIEILKTLLENDDYPQYFFSPVRADDRTEKVRRFCYHANRLGGDKFIEGYRNFILKEYNRR